MEEGEFKKRVERLEEVAKVIEKLPGEIRAEAFNLLRGYVDGHKARDRADPKAKPSDEAPESASDDDGSAEEFFGAFNHDQPADNVRLITAFLYREYGTQPFSVDELREMADNVGLTVPSRPDMTLQQAAENGKKLYTRSGRGMWKPTVHGEAHLKATYNVKKGNKKRDDSPE